SPKFQRIVAPLQRSTAVADIATFCPVVPVAGTEIAVKRGGLASKAVNWATNCVVDVDWSSNCHPATALPSLSSATAGETPNPLPAVSVSTPPKDPPGGRRDASMSMVEPVEMAQIATASPAASIATSGKKN